MPAALDSCSSRCSWRPPLATQQPAAAGERVRASQSPTDPTRLNALGQVDHEHWTQRPGCSPGTRFGAIAARLARHGAQKRISRGAHLWLAAGSENRRLHLGRSRAAMRITRRPSANTSSRTLRRQSSRLSAVRSTRARRAPASASWPARAPSGGTSSEVTQIR